MLRFVDLNDFYWTNPDGSEDAQCAILDTVTNRFLECDGKHVLGDIDEVRDAAGERGVELVPSGFFEQKQGRGWAPISAAPGTGFVRSVRIVVPPMTFDASGDPVPGRDPRAS